MSLRTICLNALPWLLCTAALADTSARIHRHAAIDLPPPAQRGASDLTIEAFGQRWALSLRDHQAPFARLEHSGREAMARRGNRFLTGSIVGRPGSWARLNWTGGRWWGGFHDGQSLYLIDRAAHFRLSGDTSPAAGRSVLFRLEDLDLTNVVGHDALPPGKAAATALIPSGSSSAPRSLPVTIVADSAFQASHGSESSAIVWGRINFVDGIYSSQLGTGIVLDHFEPLADDGSLTATDAAALLQAFRDYMTDAGGDIPFNGLAHLFTSRSRDGSVAGIAYLGVLCNQFYGYGVDWDASGETINSLVFAHELGHNFAAPHDGAGACVDETFRGIMNPGINGSQEFSDCSLTQMQPEVEGALSCLVTTPNAGLIFKDGFGLAWP